MRFFHVHIDKRVVSTSLLRRQPSCRDRVGAVYFGRWTAGTQVLAVYQANMGTSAARARTDAYMRSITREHVPLLDPTGVLCPYPSDAIIIKPPGFGLGRGNVTAAALECMQKRHGKGDLAKSLLLSHRARWELQRAALC